MTPGPTTIFILLLNDRDYIVLHDFLVFVSSMFFYMFSYMCMSFQYLLQDDKIWDGEKETERKREREERERHIDREKGKERERERCVF